MLYAITLAVMLTIINRYSTYLQNIKDYIQQKICTIVKLGEQKLRLLLKIAQITKFDVSSHHNNRVHFNANAS